ncbi:hypothetical protein LEP1GSC013_2968 [Leptospira interrogans serovar Valbuzzi str. Duyster]|nr:hypothetical protein LEP1GSC013_2968 [Leptospira interrogans serovar Valbuzzi str. Duyster]ENO72727.1 hypothetical protein LEP1GSC012_2733 [Leptospira interrogans serovar Valbuzzi str. Valbuzzi]
MGKQIAVIMTKIDESSFLDFLKSISEIQILKADASSASKDAFMIDDFSKDHENDFIYSIFGTNHFLGILNFLKLKQIERNKIFII